MTDSTIDTDEIQKFSDLADDWWDPNGSMKPLHQLNPVRLTFIRDWALSHFGRDGSTMRPLSGLRLLDIGCGAGLLTEPLTRLGAEVTGIDASGRNIAVATLHAEEAGLDIRYRDTTSEALAAEGGTFDIVLNMEVVEHVSNVPLYMKSCADLVAPGGLLFSATINRTARSLAFAKFAAEYVLRWLPPGTHEWDRFVTPDELKALLTRNGLKIVDQTGIVFHPLGGEWRPSRDMGINYMVLAEKPSRAV